MRTFVVTELPIHDGVCHRMPAQERLKLSHLLTELQHLPETKRRAILNLLEAIHGYTAGQIDALADVVICSQI